MLRRRRLSSGVRLGPPLPLRLLNKLGPLVRSLGLWPRIDIKRQMQATERKYKRNNWTPEFQRALPPRAHAFNEDADLSLFGALVIRGQFLKSMDNALALEDLIARNPQILQEQIRRPLFVLGLARTGTTLLQRLLSLHSGARYLPFWEGYTPYPRELGNHKGGNDGRYREAKNRLKMLNWVGTRVQQDPSHRDRRSGGVLPPFPQPLPGAAGLRLRQRAELLGMVGRQGPRRLLSHAQAAAAGAAVARAAPALGAEVPQPSFGAAAAAGVYPDARIVYTHRDPEKTVPSLCSLAAVTWCMTSDTVDLHNVGEFALDLAERCEAAGRAAMQVVPRDQIVHVEYQDLVADPAAMAMSVYERLGIRPTRRSRRA